MSKRKAGGRGAETPKVSMMAYRPSCCGRGGGAILHADLRIIHIRRLLAVALVGGLVLSHDSHFGRRFLVFKTTTVALTSQSPKL